MEGNIATLVSSLSQHVKLRDVLGIRTDNTFLVYRILLKYIDYCLHKPDLIYRNYAKVLLDKVSELEYKCPKIKPKKLKDEQGIVLRSKEIASSSNNVTLSYKDLVDVIHSGYPISNVLIESSDYTIGGKDSVILDPFTSVVLENKYVYFPCSPTQTVEVSKVVHNNLTALGYNIYDLVEDALYYKNENGNKLAVKVNILLMTTIKSIVKVNAISYCDDRRITSNTALISILTDIPRVEDASIESTSEHNSYIAITPSVENKTVKLSLNGYRLDIKDFYDITFISRFLEVKGNVVKLSRGYTYEYLGKNLIAIPTYVQSLLKNNYSVEEATPTVITLSKLLIDGNKDIVYVNVFNVTTSLNLKYRTKEDGKEPSNESSITFVVDIPNEQLPTLNSTAYIW